MKVKEIFVKDLVLGSVLVKQNAFNEFYTLKILHIVRGEMITLETKDSEDIIRRSHHFQDETICIEIK